MLRLSKLNVVIVYLYKERDDDDDGHDVGGFVCLAVSGRQEG